MKIHRRFFVVAASALAMVGFGLSRASAQVTLLNGGFEGPTESANTITAGGGDFWTPTGTDFIVTNDYGSLGNTPYGSQYLGLSAASTDSQLVTGFVAGQTYVLGADFYHLVGSAPTTFTLSVSGAATSTGTFTATGSGAVGDGTIPYQSAVIIFVPTTSGSATITLSDSTAAGNRVAVDNVALYGGVPAVPEPTPTAAVLLGAGGLAMVAFRRRAGRA